MKNFFKLFGIIALVAVIGFSMAACVISSSSYLELQSAMIFAGCLE